MNQQEIAGQVIGYIEQSGQALGEAQALHEKVAAERTKIASIAPAVALELQRQDLLPASDSPAFIEKISSHEGAIGVIRKLASMLSETRRKVAQQGAASPGVAVDPGNPNGAGTNSMSCFVGQPTGSGQRDRAKYASEVALGLAPVE